jgi:hypothetical protein
MKAGRRPKPKPSGGIERRVKWEEEGDSPTDSEAARKTVRTPPAAEQEAQQDCPACQ